MNWQKAVKFSLGPLISALVSFITLPVLAWIYSPDDIGRFSVFQIIISLLVVFFTLGLDQAYVREYHAESKEISYLNQFFNHVFPGVVFFILASFILTLNTGYLIKIFFDDFDSTLMYYLLSVVIFTFLMNHVSVFFRMEGKAFLFSIAQVMPKVLFLLFTSISYVFLKHLGFNNIVQLLQIALFLSLLTLFLLVSRNGEPKKFGLRIERQYLQKIFRYSLPIMISAVLFWMVLAIDRFSLKFFSDLNQLALYSVAFSFAGVGLLLQNVFSMLWFPEIYKEYEDTGVYENLENVQGVMLFICVLVFSATGLLSPVIPFLLPQEYNEVQYLVMSSIAYPIFLVISEVTGVGIGLKRKTFFALVSTLIAFSINLLGNYLLVPMLGATGAVVSSAVSFYVFTVAKTEFSCALWVSINRLRLYFVLTMMLVFSIVSALFEIPLLSMYISLFLIISSPLIFRSEIKYIFNRLNKIMVTL